MFRLTNRSLARLVARFIVAVKFQPSGVAVVGINVLLPVSGEIHPAARRQTPSMEFGDHAPIVQRNFAHAYTLAQFPKGGGIGKPVVTFPLEVFQVKTRNPHIGIVGMGIRRLHYSGFHGHVSFLAEAAVDDEGYEYERCRDKQQRLGFVVVVSYHG